MHRKNLWPLWGSQQLSVKYVPPEAGEFFRKVRGRGLRLVKSGRQGALRVIFSRTGLFALLFLAQLLLLFALFFWVSGYASRYIIAAAVFSFLMVVSIVNRPIDAAGKLVWMVLIGIVPVFGALLYAYTETDLGHRRLAKRIEGISEQGRGSIVQDPDAIAELEKASPRTAQTARFIAKSGCYPVFTGTQSRYFPSGEEALEAMIDAIDSAREYVFLEYFIIEEGVMWGRLLERLAARAAQGLEVRLIYDGMGTMARLPDDYPERLSGLGIACRVFSPLRPFVSTLYNCRDHRKIMVADGKVAFTGGINLADEYINRTQPYGYWKDCALRLEGPAAQSFALMFLQMWESCGEDEPEEFSRFLRGAPSAGNGCGFAIPYSENPLDDFLAARAVYIDMLNRASRYVHIMTPYLILDAETEYALRLAALRGTEVILMLPGKTDSFAAGALAKSHYSSLLRAGVRIFEFTPGFLHSKIFVSDDKAAVVGTVNLDYRSLHHHFECAVLLERAQAVNEIERDFNRTLEYCREVTEDSLREIPRRVRISGAVLKIFAPLL